MAFEAIKTQIRILLEGSIEEPEDAHEMHLQLLAKLNEMPALTPCPRPKTDLAPLIPAACRRPGG